jgi:hypothetical protein
MKYIKYYTIVLALIISGLTSCIKDEPIVLKGSFVEFDAATYNANAAGLTYPILTRLVKYGEASNNADPALTRASGLVKFRINLVGPQRATATTVTYQVVATGTTAVAGTHFTTTGTTTIPANSSFGEVEVQILNAGASTAGARDLVLELIGAADLPPSENEKRLGIRIAQN